jgi:UDP-glucose 4-epimerase
MHFLVTGGAGYIGSHTVRALLQQGHSTKILDNFSTGHKWATQEQEVIDVDLKDLTALRSRLSTQHFDGVFHFAAKSLVRESNQEPLKYYQNNLVGTANLLQVALENGWNKIVFSSTAAVYGNPIYERIREDHPKAPINVYGQTKLAMEHLLESVCKATSFSSVCLRYFNAAGAASDVTLGEAHDPETHLIPNALRAAAGNGQAMTIFGTDYPTPDGTCVRDYIHVEDLADAHIKAMDYLNINKGFSSFNLGCGRGFSVKEIIAACELVVGSEIPKIIGARREGDPAVLVADAAKARQKIGWTPAKSEIIEIVESAWAWELMRGHKAIREPHNH